MSSNSDVNLGLSNANARSIDPHHEEPTIEIESHSRVGDVESEELHIRVGETVAERMPNDLPDATHQPVTERNVSTSNNLRADFEALKKTDSKSLKKIKMTEAKIKTMKIAGAVLIGIGGLATVTGLGACFCGMFAGLPVALVGMGMIVGGGMLMTAAADAEKKLNPEQRANLDSNVKNLKESLNLMDKYPKTETSNGGSYEEFLANISDNEDKTNPIGDLNNLASLYKLSRLENDHAIVRHDIADVNNKIADLEEKINSTEITPEEKKLAEKEKKELNTKLEGLNKELLETANPAEITRLKAELDESRQAAAVSNAKLANPDIAEAETTQIDAEANPPNRTQELTTKIEKHEAELQSLKNELAELTGSSATNPLPEIRGQLDIKRDLLTKTEADLKEINDNDENIIKLKSDIAAVKSSLSVLVEPEGEVGARTRPTTPNAATDFLNETIQSEKNKLEALQTQLEAAQEKQTATLEKKNELLASKDELTAQINALESKMSSAEGIVSRIQLAETNLAAAKAELKSNENLRNDPENQTQSAQPQTPYPVEKNPFKRNAALNQPSTSRTRQQDELPNQEAQDPVKVADEKPMSTEEMNAMIKDLGVETEPQPETNKSRSTTPKNRTRTDETQELNALLDDIERTQLQDRTVQTRELEALLDDIERTQLQDRTVQIQETDIQIENNNNKIQDLKAEIREDKERRASLKTELIETMQMTFPLKKAQVESKHYELTGKAAYLRHQLSAIDPPKTQEEIKKLKADLAENQMHLKKFKDLINTYKATNEVKVLENENIALMRKKTALSMENMGAGVKVFLETQPENKLSDMKDRRIEIRDRLIELGVGKEISDINKKVTTENINKALEDLKLQKGVAPNPDIDEVTAELKQLQAERKQLHDQRNAIRKQLENK